MTAAENNIPKCPVDGTVLVNGAVEDVPLLQCPTCGGHWLYFGDLETLAEHHGEQIQSVAVGAHSAGQAERHCPIDGTLMDTRTFADHRDLRIQQCPQCRGSWLDSTELETLLALAAPDHETQPTLDQRAMLFLYALVKHPPFY